MIGLAPPLLFRAILDTAIPEGDRTLVVVLASITVLVALVDAGLGIVQRWYQARVGEGLIYDLRIALFDNVQRMPIAFFTRTQTGALDQPPEQRRDRRAGRGHRHARLGRVATSSCSSTTLIAMFVLEWRLTLLALVVLPLFIIPAKRVGRAHAGDLPRADGGSTPR